VTLQSDLVKALMTKRSDLGWGAIPLRAQQLAASRGTTPFDALFLSLSLFVILAALMLIALLLRLGLMQRAKEYGVLLATGFPGPAASRLAILEGAWTAIPGILLGLIGGLAYAAIVLAGLRSWWVGAVTVPFLEFHATPRSLLLGALSGAAAALLTIGITARRLRRTPARELLAGRFEDYTGDATDGQRSGRWQWDRIIPWTLLALAALTALIGLRVSGPAQAGAFVGSGMLLLFATLLAIYARLATKPNRDSQPRSTTASPSHKSPSQKAYSLTRLAWGNVGRNPLRSTLSVGLMASAAFLIVSISAFQLNPSESGVGGFDLIGQSTTPIYRDLNDPIVRSELLGPDADRLASARIVAMRLQPGQDASCNNLYQASQPQVFGIPTTMGDATRDRPFAWAATSPKGEGAKTTQGSTDKGPTASPWDALNVLASGTADDPVPLILDQNTAMWSLQMRGGVGEVRSFSWREGETLHFRVVGLLANSVLQGSLLIGEDNFRKLFPQINGYRNFLIRTDDPATVSQSLENRLSDAGMDITPSRTVLARLMAVQNTYLRTFQSLGALGLLLGTIGLAIAQLRGALERQGELAVMRAIGFARRRLATAVMCETGIVLALGIGSGVLCAILAVAPYLLTGQSVPPIIEPLLWVLLIATFGLAAGSLAVAKVIRMPLVDSLRK
jgi:ABC-type antimicrobial peptide transport system permease subunit